MDLLSIDMDIYDSIVSFQKIDSHHPQRHKNYIISKSYLGGCGVQLFRKLILPMEDLRCPK